MSSHAGDAGVLATGVAAATFSCRLFRSRLVNRSVRFPPRFIVAKGETRADRDCDVVRGRLEGSQQAHE